MKLFRFAGLLVVAAALFTASPKAATAGAPVTCYKYCSGHFYSGWCWLSLSECCQLNQQTCPDPWEFEGGDCTDGQNYCP
jgi:hypothetical protein